MTDERTPPKRIRTTGLQEAQIQPLVEIERACAAMYHDVGFDAAEVPVRTPADIVALTRNHNLHVAEADHVVAGYLAWRDEAPGVAYVEALEVGPEHQRFGVATKLLEALKDDARGAGIRDILVKCWTRATWASRFYGKHGFRAIDAAAPEKVRAYCDGHASSGRPLTRPGEALLWAPVGDPASSGPASDPDPWNDDRTVVPQ